MHILLIEDFEDLAHIARQEICENLSPKLLETTNFQMFNNAADAMAFLKENHQDTMAVITDIQLESENAGFEVVSLTKELNPHTQIFIVTGKVVPKNYPGIGPQDNVKVYRKPISLPIYKSIADDISMYWSLGRIGINRRN